MEMPVSKQQLTGKGCFLEHFCFQKCSAFIVQSCIMQTPCTIYNLGQFFKTGHGIPGAE